MGNKKSGEISVGVFVFVRFFGLDYSPFGKEGGSCYGTIANRMRVEGIIKAGQS